MESTHPLKAYREREALSQRELAKRLGVSRQTIIRWENCIRYPQRKRTGSICEITGIPLNELLGFDGGRG